MSINKKIIDLSRELRRNQTEEESKLWQQLRNRKLKGLKFLRQHPISYDFKNGKSKFFIADFYCDEMKSVIEVDGKIHDFQRDYDENRDQILSELGLTTLRIKNEEVEKVYDVLKKIRAFIDQLPTHPRSHVVRSSPSLQGREEGTSPREVRGELAILLLAAGSSSRMGQSKQLLSIKNEPLFIRSINAALGSSIGNVLVVLGANEKEHQSLIKHLPVQIIHNKNWENGMGSSIKSGLKHLLTIQPDVAAVIIMVCDQPLLTSSHLNKMIDNYTLTKNRIVASYYSGTAGVPALFDKQLFSEILDLPDDLGAKKLINKYNHELLAIDFPEGETDIDTWEEYLLFEKKLESGKGK